MGVSDLERIEGPLHQIEPAGDCVVPLGQLEAAPDAQVSVLREYGEHVRVKVRAAVAIAWQRHGETYEGLAVERAYYLTAERLGVNRISLNFAMFRSAFEQGAQLGAGPIARLWRGLLLFFSRWWQLETLYRSNMKYQPEWVPRYACYEDARLIPRVGVASAMAEVAPTIRIRCITNSLSRAARKRRRTSGQYSP